MVLPPPHYGVDWQHCRELLLRNVLGKQEWPRCKLMCSELLNSDDSAADNMPKGWNPTYDTPGSTGMRFALH